jgi:hypothetical protein
MISDPADHDEAIGVITIAEMRKLAAYTARPASPLRAHLGSRGVRRWRARGARLAPGAGSR